MLSVPHTVRILLHADSVDLRKSFDGLSGIVSQAFPQEELLSGHLFLFLNRRRDRIKILYWNVDGLAIWYYRLEAGSFQVPLRPSSDAPIELRSAQLAMLLGGIDLGNAQQRKRYRRPEKNRENPGKTT
ncbi:IS66 Orf2 like protein [Singulisphaera sp. GP187]|uniref:IS66 family insertion sequence element accessory protein TnpB n=1 Tax=Singulisphaera sp. GP187 TaxID=1882752 RepID=UPI00092631A9|nr:IS66 family insertion sequence element accessory protein TnpB [Singulisphaera sp. GP187]SIN83607.1 IS66 Orf2 like protein [Singulisphaera sp. GP187]SIO16371.1 IS66 Orf2 like protein [Singulisphaera sp. GP187]SIO41542.1 IS66 Orf2 like protein [Singulisphaera sp. GP187]SIO57861.1 IS66 Orf2 like protein [Singulisphaera sp. GP187]SIO58902.1 IS66 Orf2 like protein [Singulisphaera sp. GP187]